MNCLDCGTKMKKQKKKPYKFTECGLNNIILLDIESFNCVHCHEEEILIPFPEKLHRIIAQNLATQSQQLLPEEIRFLRAHLGFSGIGFANTIGVQPETVSRWENGSAKMSVPHERLLRTLILCEFGPIRDYFETLKDLATKEASRKNKKTFTLKKQDWKLAA